MEKTIWMLWLQGWDHAPALSRACLESWRQRNPGWTVRAVDLAQAEALLPEMGLTALRNKPAAISDRIRLALLARYGGVWADATVFCIIPLDEWLPVDSPTGFFAFHRPGPGRPLATWLLGARAGAPLVTAWHDASEGYWRGRRKAGTYYWVHHLFGELVRKDPALRRQWRATPSRSARPPHFFATYGDRMYGPMPRGGLGHIASRRSPVYKLTNGGLPSSPHPASAYALFTVGEMPGADARNAYTVLDRLRESWRQDRIWVESRRLAASRRRAPTSARRRG